MKTARPRRGTQAAPSYRRRFVCEACGKGRIQRGPGRSRRFCDLPKCQSVAKRRREIPVSLSDPEVP